MAKDTIKSCRNCGWAEWQRGKNGRRLPLRPGRCEAPTPTIVVPWAYVYTLSRGCIWMDGTTGRDCLMWKPEEE